MWSAKDWQESDKKSSCPLFTLPWNSGCNVMYDWMHSKYLGTDTVILGAALWLLCFKEMDASPKENLKVAWLHIQEFQKQHCPGTS